MSRSKRKLPGSASTIITPLPRRSRRGGLLALVLSISLIGLSLAAGPVSAALNYPFDGQLAPQQEGTGPAEANGIAIDDANGHTYVVSSTRENPSVQVFDTTTGAQLPDLDAAGTPVGSFGGDGSGGHSISVAAYNANGRIYVLDPDHGVVDVFGSNQEYLCQITGAATPSSSECNGPSGSQTPTGGFDKPSGLAIDQTNGSVYVLDPEHDVVDVFDSAGAYHSQIDLEQVPGGLSFVPLIQGLAVNGQSGRVFVADKLEAKIYEFATSGSYLSTLNGAGTPTGSFGQSLSVAVDNGNGQIFVSDPQTHAVEVLDSSGAFVAQITHSFDILTGVEVDQATGRVYVSNAGQSPAPSVIDIFGPSIVIPESRTGAPSDIGPTEATINGTVNPAGLPITECYFEWGETTSYGHTAECEPPPGSLPADGNGHSVKAVISDLKPGRTYHYRLSAANANDAGSIPNPGADELLHTLPNPLIDEAHTIDITPTSATLAAEIDPRGFASTCAFEWGRTAEPGNPAIPYEHTEPCEPPTLGSGTTDVAASLRLTGLAEGAGYHWRILATSANGTADAFEQTFVYLPPAQDRVDQNCPNQLLRNDNASLALPDCRAYELVTPQRKNGALIGTGVLINAGDFSSDGSTVILSSIQCFAAPASCNALRQNEGTPFSFTRTPTGWQTTPLAPPALAEDGSSGWITDADTGASLSSAPAPPGGQDEFYLRRADGSVLDLGPATPPASGPLGPVFGGYTLVGSADLSHVAFQLPDDHWPFDQTFNQTGGHLSVYELTGANNATPSLVGVDSGQSNTTLISSCQTQLGRNSHTISADGHTVFFVALSDQRGACPATVQAPPVNELYARIGGSETVPISQTGSADCTGACLTAELRDASFEDASRDGSKVFFTDTQHLVNPASQDPNASDTSAVNGCEQTSGPNGCNLYEYDFSNPAGHQLIDVSAGDSSGLGPEVQRVLTSSADGSHVFFVARGVLTTQPNSQGASAVAGEENVYVFARDALHPNGHTAFVATVGPNEVSGHSVTGGSPPNVSPDGRYYVFTSRRDLTADDTSSSAAGQVFLYDSQAEDLSRISIGELGFNDNGNVPFAEACAQAQCPLEATIAQPLDVSRRDPTMSHDASHIFFTSPVGLTPEALDRVQISSSEGVPIYAQNVYEYHAGHVSLISDGRDTAPISRPPHGLGAVELVGSDAEGANVFFTTADPLISQDSDTQLDYYDARVNGGFAKPAGAEICLTADACHGTVTEAGAQPSPATSGFNGPGNVRETKCKEGFVRKHGKCVKRHARKHHKRRHHKRAANPNRRAGK